MKEMGVWPPEGWTEDNERSLRVCPMPDINALGKRSRNAFDADGRLIRSAAQVGTQWLVTCRSYSPSGKLIKAWGQALTAAVVSPLVCHY